MLKPEGLFGAVSLLRGPFLLCDTQLSAKGHSVLIIEAGSDGSWSPAIRNAEDHAFPPAFCNWQYPVYEEDGRQLPWTANAGACIGGSTSSEF